MKELIFLHAGDCGCNIGTDLWQLFAKEHGLSEGSFTTSSTINNVSCLYDESIRKENVYHPRCLFIDNDPLQAHKLRKSEFKSLLFKEENMVISSGDSSSNIARGYSQLLNYKDYIGERIRKMIENCDSVQSALITNSIGGGSGSGCLMHLLTDEFQIPMSSFTVWPTSTYSSSSLEPYNAVLGFSNAVEHLKCVFSFDNYSLVRACERSGIKNPCFKDMNHLISQSISSLTSQIRFLNQGSFNEVCSFLVPSTSLNLISNNFVNFKETTSDYSIEDLISSKTSMNDIDQEGLSLAMNISMRGLDFSQNHITSLSKKLSEWKFQNHDVNSSVRYHISNKAPENIHSTREFNNTIHVANNTCSIEGYLRNLITKFELLRRTHAFDHHVRGEGIFNRADFAEAHSSLSSIASNYASLTEP